jgi:hypothetical protein
MGEYLFIPKNIYFFVFISPLVFFFFFFCIFKKLFSCFYNYFINLFVKRIGELSEYKKLVAFLIHFGSLEATL